MTDRSRTPLSTDPDDFCFFDTETRSHEDVTTAGAYRHNAAGMVIILTYAIGADGPVREWVVPDFDTPLDQHYMPDALRLFLIRARQGKAWFVAWNAAFDRLSFNRGIRKPNTPQAPYLTVEMVIDAMAQGGKSHLPPDLAGAAEAAGSPIGKQKDGKRLIKLFCDAAGDATPQTHPEDWEKFKSYARDDVGALREIFFGTMPLSRAEWEEYWASERINDTGLPVDGEFAQQAAALAERNAKEVQRQVKEISRGELYSVNQTARMTDWVMERIGHLSRARRILTSEVVEGEPDADGNDVHEAKLSLQRSRVEELILYLEKLDAEQGLTDGEADALDMLDVRVYGASATPMKFGKIARQLENGRLRGSYVFNGANATGRFCVAADTKVLTPEGLRVVVSLSPGEFVVSGTGARRKVLALVHKGRDTLYTLRGPRGEHLTCTLSHRIATNNGWKRIDECFARDAAGQGNLRPSCIPLSVEGLDDHAAGQRNGHQLPDIGLYTPTAHPGGRTEEVARVLPLGIQERREEPYVRRADCGGAGSARWSACGLERIGLHVRAPDNRREELGRGRDPGTHGSASHRRQQDEQRPGQLGALHQAWAPMAAQRAAWSLEKVGEGDVWDISVERDQSYLAGGLIHHNSSRGIQVHNLARSTIGEREADTIDMIAAEGAGAYEDLADRFGPVGRTLSRLIRPAITAPDDKMLVWGDWSAIEARVLPWLAASPSADEVLNTFRRNDADPSLPDNYRTTASGILRVLGQRVAPEEVTGAQRQSHGKVPTLSLGFGGGNGALFAMGLNYGVSFNDDEATEVVRAWRDSNPWARRFWDALWTAALSTLESPDTVFTAGRVQLVYIKDYMSGTLFMILPCGRELMYPRIRWEKREIKDKNTGKVRERTQLTYRRGRGRAALWYGTLAENATQGFAGSLMRELLTGLVYDSPMNARGLGPLLTPVGHTHDEAVTLADAEDAEAAKQALHDAMVRLPDYAEDLPIAAGVTAHYCYTKTLD